MKDYRLFGHDNDYPQYIVDYEPNHVFEYAKTANELAMETDGDVVELYTTSLYISTFATEDDVEFIGYGVMVDDELI